MERERCTAELSSQLCQQGPCALGQLSSQTSAIQILAGSSSMLI